MIAKPAGSVRRLTRHAAAFAACLVLVCPTQAEDLTFRDDGSAIEVTGRYLGFDGEMLSVLTKSGPVSLRGEGLLCEGEACPDLSNYTPNVRFVGAGRVGELLLPALIDVYARDHGLAVHEDETGFALTDADSLRRLTLEINTAGAQESFLAFVGHDADILMSMRELSAAELAVAHQAGLGQLDSARQIRILAVDALVPVVSPLSDLVSITISDLLQALAGRDPAQFTIHFPAEEAGQLLGFEDRFLRPEGLGLSRDAVLHTTVESLLDGVESDPKGLALLSYGATGNTQPLGLTGVCGVRNDARFLTLKTEDYPLTFPIYLYQTNRRLHPNVKHFMDWLRSPSAQLVIRRAGFVDLAAVPIPLSRQGDRLANAIRNAGPEVHLEELQRMVQFLSPRVRMSSTFRFEQGEAHLDGPSRSNVLQLAQAIRDGQFGGRELTFVGFSDGLGPALENRDLSATRADSIRRAVEQALGGNIPSNVQLGVDAFGEALPIACDETIWGQHTNRRVELWVRDVRR